MGGYIGSRAVALSTTAADVTSLTIDSTTTVSSILDQDDMSSNSATALATQQSIKAYVLEVLVLPSTCTCKYNN